MGKDAGMFGIGHDNPNITDEDKLRFDACISWDDKTVEGGKYTMFLHKGAYENLKSTYDMIGDWIVESGVNIEDKPMFEKYLYQTQLTTGTNNIKKKVQVQGKFSKD
jgi:AraC family transcriptional regulator